MGLPKPIELYFASANSNDTEDLDACFAVDATVQDEGHTYKGLAAIKEWKSATRKRYEPKIEPRETVERNGKTVVRSTVSGNFPGSPVKLEFIFGLQGNKITSLEIQ